MVNGAFHGTEIDSSYQGSITHVPETITPSLTGATHLTRTTHLKLTQHISHTHAYVQPAVQHISHSRNTSHTQHTSHTHMHRCTLLCNTSPAWCRTTTAITLSTRVLQPQPRRKAPQGSRHQDKEDPPAPLKCHLHTCTLNMAAVACQTCSRHTLTSSPTPRMPVRTPSHPSQCAHTPRPTLLWPDSKSGWQAWKRACGNSSSSSSRRGLLSLPLVSPGWPHPGEHRHVVTAARVVPGHNTAPPNGTNRPTQ